MVSLKKLKTIPIVKKNGRTQKKLKSTKRRFKNDLVNKIVYFYNIIKSKFCFVLLCFGKKPECVGGLMMG